MSRILGDLYLFCVQLGCTIIDCDIVGSNNFCSIISVKTSFKIGDSLCETFLYNYIINPSGPGALPLFICLIACSISTVDKDCSRLALSWSLIVGISIVAKKVLYLPCHTALM